MKCKFCKSAIEDGSLYCRFCGGQQFTPEKKQISIPKPRQLSDGSYCSQLMVDGVRYYVHADTLEDYELKARATKARIIDAKKAPPKLPTLGDAIDKYIESNSLVLSPSTIRGYTNIRNNRFSAYMSLPINAIDYQQMVNDEAKLCGPKTLHNAWGLVLPSLRAIKYQDPDVNLPAVPIKDLAFLDFQQISDFLSVAKDSSVELCCLLALHSLRMSELLALTSDDVVDGYINVNKSLVRDRHNNYVLKDVTKTAASSRTIPIMIPRLYELLSSKSGRLVTVTPVTIERQIAVLCANASLPYIGCHGLRRSFASLAYHLGWNERTVMAIGGWSNMQTVHNVYIKLSSKDVNDDVKSMMDYYNNLETIAAERML